MASPAAVLSILVKAQGVQTTAGQLKSLDAAGRNAGKGMATAETSAKRSSKSFSAVGTAAKSAGLLLGAAGLAKGLQSAISEYREAQKVGGQTTAVLKSTGNAAKVTRKHIEDLAGGISKKTGIDDEQIQASENMLLTFTKLRNETGKGNKIFDQATQVVTDMSVALGQSGKSSAIQLGKALNDPIKGITALRRVGVAFTADQQKQIKAMVESGDLLGAQKAILKELRTEFAGSAAAQATAGDKLKVSLGNLAEAAGGVLVPALDKVARWFTKVIDQFVEGKGVAKVIIARFVELGTALLPFAESVKQIVGWLQKHNDVAKILIVTLGGLAAAIVLVNLAMAANPFVLAAVAIAALVVGVVTAYREFETFRKIVDGAVKVVGTIAGALATAGAAVGSAFTAMVAWVSGAMDTVTTEIGKWNVAATVVNGAVTAIKTYVSVAMTATVAVVQAALTLLAPLFTAAFGVIKAVVTGAFAAIKAIVAGGLQVIRGIVQVFGGILKGDFGQIWEGVKNIFRGIGTAIAGILRAQLGTVSAAGKAIGKGLIDGFKAALNLAHELAVAMRDLIAKAPGFALGVGKAIVSGIISGIKAAAGGIGNALKGAVKGATPDFLGIGDGIGKSIGAGSIVPVKGGGSLMGARPIMSRFAAVGAAKGLTVRSGMRAGAITSSGNQSWHSTGEAIDLGNGAGPDAAKMSVFRTLRSRFGSRLAELIYTPGGAGIKNGQPYTYTGQVARDHYDHVHVAFDSGKPGLGDGLGKMQATGTGIGDGLGGNVKAVWQFLIAKGFTPAQAAGIIGVMQGESGKGLSTTATNKKSGAYGIAQWLGGRKSALMGKKNPSSLQTQLSHLWSELQGPEKASLAKIKGAHSIDEAVSAWLFSFERPGKGEANLPGRTANARSVFAALKGVGGKGASKKGVAAAKVNPYDLAIAQSDVAIASAKTHKVGGVGGRIVSADLAKYAAILSKEKVMGARIRKIRGALQGKLTKSTRLRLTQELAQLIPEHQQLARDRAALRAPAAPTDSGLGSDVGGGDTSDPNQPLIDAINAAAETERLQTEAMNAHTDAVKALQDEIKAQTQFATQVVATENYQLAKGLADILSSQIVGIGVAGRTLVPGAGALARY